MATRKVVIRTADGLHARPAAELARRAQAHSSRVTLTSPTGVAVDAASVLAVMNLALAEGDAVVLATADAVGAEAALDALAAVLDPRG